VFHIPQGTVLLGWLYFILYLIGLLNIKTETEIMCFADDTGILTHDKNIEKLCNKANVIFNTTKSYIYIYIWYDNNLLELNLSKTK
jgi:hypothetical protein